MTWCQGRPLSFVRSFSHNKYINWYILSPMFLKIYLVTTYKPHYSVEFRMNSKNIWQISFSCFTFSARWFSCSVWVSRNSRKFSYLVHTFLSFSLWIYHYIQNNWVRLRHKAFHVHILPFINFKIIVFIMTAHCFIMTKIAKD